MAYFRFQAKVGQGRNFRGQGNPQGSQRSAMIRSHGPSRQDIRMKKGFLAVRQLRKIHRGAQAQTGLNLAIGVSGLKLRQ